MRLNFRFEPDLLNWHKEGRGVYVSNDGLQRVEKNGNQWTSAVRATIDEPWEPTGNYYGALHAAQDCCRRTLAKLCRVPGGDGPYLGHWQATEEYPEIYEGE